MGLHSKAFTCFKNFGLHIIIVVDFLSLLGSGNFSDKIYYKELMASFCFVNIVGNLGSDPQLKSNTGAAGNGQVAEFSIAVNPTNSRQGDNMPATWYRVSFWNQRADAVMKLLKKGSTVYITGRLNVRDYTTSAGEKRYSLDVTGMDFQLVGSRQDNMGGNQVSDSGMSEPSNAYLGGSSDADDLPF